MGCGGSRAAHGGHGEDSHGRSDAARPVTCGATSPSPAPRAAAEETQSPAANSPSTVFFLKRDAMVRDRAPAARLGPVRSVPAKQEEEKEP